MLMITNRTVIQLITRN